MTNCAMLVCSFYVKKRFCHGNSMIYNLNQEITVDNEETTESFTDFFEIISSFCDKNVLFKDVEKSRKMFSVRAGSVTSFDDTTYRAMSFIVQSGSYGIEADMTNRYTMEVSYHRTEDEADIKSFQCVVYIFHSKASYYPLKSHPLASLCLSNRS